MEVKKLNQITNKQLDCLIDIWLNGNLAAHAFIDAEYWKSNQDFVRNALPEADVYIAEEQNEIIGFAGIKNNYVAGIFVKKQYQKNGVGTKLMNVLKKQYSMLSLSVYVKNTSATQFYLNHGFIKDGENIDSNTNEIELQMKLMEEYDEDKN